MSRVNIAPIVVELITVEEFALLDGVTVPVLAS